MSCPLQHLCIWNSPDFLWGSSKGGSHVDTVSLILRLYSPYTSYQLCGYACTTVARMASNLHPREGMSPTRRGLLQPTACGDAGGARAVVLCIGNFMTSSRTPFTSPQIPLVSFRILTTKMP